VRDLFFILTAVAAVAALLFVKRGGTPTLTRDAFLQAREHEDKMLLLDVRSQKEFEAGHIPDAVNVPHDHVVSGAEEVSGDKAERIVVYCERGPRAIMAQQALIRAGFSNVVHLAGDMSGWRANGLPTEK
jgi:phage shock protein E